MTLMERKRMIEGAMRKLEDRIIALRYCEYDGQLSVQDRDTEIATLQRHMLCAKAVKDYLEQMQQEEPETA